MLRSSRKKMLGGLGNGLSECGTRRNGCEGATGGHCGLIFEDSH